MQNMKEVASICKKYSIPLNIDAARYAENAFFVKKREVGYGGASIKEIVREMFSHADMFTMSAKKDAIANMGGLIGVRDADPAVVSKIKANCISHEGYITYGGLSGRDLEALAIGLYEGIDESFLEYRIGQMEYLAAKLEQAGIVYQSPVGGHGIFVDAARMFPQIPPEQFPGQVLAVELYKAAGIRSCDVGSFMLGNDPETKEQMKADFEFTRLAFPRRVYTQAHLDITAEALIEVQQRAPELKHGYRIIWEPAILRHFQATLEPVTGGSLS